MGGKQSLKSQCWSCN